MTPERIAELREDYSTHTSHCLVHKRTLADLLATAEREAKLREAATAVLSRLDYLQGLWGAEGVTTRLADDLRAALESKGGE